MNNLLQVDFENNSVRFVNDADGNFEFGIIAKDLALVLEYSQAKELMKLVDEEYKGSAFCPTPSGTQNMSVIWEAGVYQALARTNKPKAKPFQKKLYEEVLPEIRKTGSYLANLTPGELLLEQAKRYLEIEREQARQAKELAETTKTANEAKAGLEAVHNELSALKEFAVAQPEGLDQDKADLINQAFQQLGAVLEEAGIEVKPKCYQTPWKELGLTMRNSSINYDLNARYANAKKAYKTAHDKWVKNGKPRGQAPKKPSRISILLKDNKVTDAFKAAQQVITANLAKLT